MHFWDGCSWNPSPLSKSILVEKAKWNEFKKLASLFGIFHLVEYFGQVLKWNKGYRIKKPAGDINFCAVDCRIHVYLDGFLGFFRAKEMSSENVNVSPYWHEVSVPNAAPLLSTILLQVHPCTQIVCFTIPLHPRHHFSSSALS